jgi:transcriptional regulator of acetoin/glycerol metabolism
MNIAPMHAASPRSGHDHALPSPLRETEQDVIAAARNDRCVLLTGAAPQASALALRIHNLSGWRWGSFVAVDCGGSEAVLERQLFDLLRIRPQAAGMPEPRPRINQSGTVFLYEVGKLGLSLQHRLREVLEESDVVMRSDRLRQRIMASSSEPLLHRVLDGTFDEELFCRLTAVRLAVGPERYAI